MSNYQKYKEYYREYYQRNKDRKDKQNKEWVLKNKEKRKVIKERWNKNNPEYAKSYREKNKDKILSQEKEYRLNNKETISLKGRNYFKKNKKEIYKKRREKYNEDINYRLSDILRGRLRKALYGNYKIGSAVENLGCSVEFLKEYLESKFESGMTWDNYGPRGWHIDHIIPLSRFDLSEKDQFLEACHYTNLQPMWWKDNLSKGNRYNA